MFLFAESTKWAWENQNKISGIRDAKNRFAKQTWWFRQRGETSSVFIVQFPQSDQQLISPNNINTF